MDAMQQEAMRRVQEMHSRTHSPPPRRVSDPAPAAEPEQEILIQNSEPKNDNCAPTENTAGHNEPNMLETVFQDKERSLIMLLILILVNEGSKPEALLALMYLIM